MMASPVSSLLLIGVGGAGVRTVRGVWRAYGGSLRALAVDTDASVGSEGDVDFALLGGNRLAGRGSGGQAGAVRAAFLDDPTFLDAKLTGVRTAVVVASLGGGTANGAVGELLKHLNALGIVSLVFVTTPFAFEGEERRREAQAALGPITSHATALAVLPLDRLVADSGSDNMGEALARATDTVASGITLLWRLLEKPGYISLDAERLRSVLSDCGIVRFTAVTATGENRVAQALDQLRRSALLAAEGSARPIRKVLLGVLAGDDLRLSEVGSLVKGIQGSFAPEAALELGTVNDEVEFSGRLSVVVLLFEESATAGVARTGGGMTVRRRTLSAAERALAGGDRFGGSEKTYWHDEDLDIPTYVRRNLTLER
ncbi:MAG: hypothetical protein MJ240_06340 [Kiritimatiellae bacterium]|nr:hypothetical protein [Kiritimatiellia bacterium]